MTEPKTPSLDDPCPHPARNGRHEVYASPPDFKDMHCRACGAGTAKDRYLIDCIRYPLLFKEVHSEPIAQELCRLLVDTEVDTLQRLLESLSPTDPRPAREVLAEAINAARGKAGRT